MPTKRPTASKRTTSRKKAPAPKPTAAKKPNQIQPRPLDDDEIELSGVFGTVRYKESDPFAEVREIFDHYDRNKDGVIEQREFARVLEALGMELEEHELKLAFLDVDRKHDEKISWDEFLSWWRAMRG